MYPPVKYRGWDTVGILEEMEAEEVHFQKHSVSDLLFIQTERLYLLEISKYPLTSFLNRSLQFLQTMR